MEVVIRLPTRYYVNIHIDLKLVLIVELRFITCFLINILKSIRMFIENFPNFQNSSKFFSVV